MRTCTSVWRRGQRPLGVVREPGATESVAAYAERARAARRSRRIGTPPRGECREGGIPFGKTAGDFDGTPVKPEPYGETTSPRRTQRTQRKRREEKRQEKLERRSRVQGLARVARGERGGRTVRA